jgi:hypothetical protein
MFRHLCSADRKSESGFQMKILSLLEGASVAAESNLRDLVENVHIPISDKRTSDGVFPVVMNKFSLVN